MMSLPLMLPTWPQPPSPSYFQTNSPHFHLRPWQSILRSFPWNSQTSLPLCSQRVSLMACFTFSKNLFNTSHSVSLPPSYLSATTGFPCNFSHISMYSPHMHLTYSFPAFRSVASASMDPSLAALIPSPTSPTPFSCFISLHSTF